MDTKTINNRWRYRRRIAITSAIFLFLLEIVAIAKLISLPFDKLTMEHVIFFVIATIPLLAIVLVYFIASTFDDVKVFLIDRLKHKD